MESLIEIIVPVAFFAVFLVLVLKFWPRKGQMGINTAAVKCPNCAADMPAVRKPANIRQFLWGGWTCPECGTEMDKYGKRIGT